MSASKVTFANQGKLKKLPIPDVNETCASYLEALKPLQVIILFTYFLYYIFFVSY